MIKICNDCGRENMFFYKRDSSADGLTTCCINCIVKNRRSTEGILTQIYSSQRQMSIKRGHDLPNYSKEELGKWIFGQIHYEMIYKYWVKSGYDKYLKPSCDRKNNSKGYTLDNITLTTCGVNIKNGYKFIAEGGHLLTKVYQHSLDLQFMRSYNSISIASRKTGANRTSISKNCHKILNTAGGYVWSFKKITKIKNEMSIL